MEVDADLAGTGVLSHGGLDGHGDRQIEKSLDFY